MLGTSTYDVIHFAFVWAGFRTSNVLLNPNNPLVRAVLVAMLGEFGRTPRINANAGRDHWPNVYSVLLAGGGLKPGIVLGSSTRDGAEPRDRPIHLYDVLATIYHQLGIPTQATFRDASGRPVQVMAEGKPIAELI